MKDEQTKVQDGEVSWPDATANISARASMLIVAGTALALFLPLSYLGIPDGFDLMQHMRFAMSYENAISSGQIIPKWAGYDNFGFGSIGIRYYPPLAYATLAFIHLLSGDWYTSFWLTALGWGLVGSIGMYLWIREFSSVLAGMSAAIVYAVIPFHTFEIYQAVLYSEFAAAGIMPFCFWSLTRLYRNGTWGDAGWLAISYSLLVLTHIPTTIIATGGMIIYGSVVIDWRRFGKLAVKFVAAGVAAVSAAVFHLAKAIPEVDWVQHNTSRYFARGYYDFKSYLFPIIFSAPEDRYVEKMLWHFDGMVVITIVFFLIGLATFLIVRGASDAEALRSRIGLGLLLAGGLSILMLSIASLGIWNSVSFLQKIQFPWRWLALLSLAASALFGLATPHLFLNDGHLRRSLAYPLVGLLLITIGIDVTQNMIPSTPLSRAEFHAKIDNAYNEEACDCWWPIWAKREALDQRELIIDGRSAEVTSFYQEHRSISVSDGAGGVLRVPTFYHPYWTATVNSRPQVVQKDENGSILIPVESGQSKVELTFSEPKYVAWAGYVSLLTWVLLFAFLVSRVLRRKRAADPSQA